MMRVANPFAGSPYPTDPTGAIIGQSLGRALFGDPEMAAQAQLRRAQVEQAAANAQESTAHAGLYGEQTAKEAAINAARAQYGRVLPGPLATIFGGNPDDATAEQYIKYRAADPVLALGTRLLGGGAPAPGAAAPQEIDADGNPIITVTAPKPGVDTENGLRALASIFTGNLPTENTAMTVGQADRHQRADLNNKIAVENIQSGDRRYAANASSGASRYNSDLDYKASVYGTDQHVGESRYEHDHPKATGLGEKITRFAPSQLGNMDSEINQQAPGLSNDIKTQVRARAVELTQQTGNPAAAVQQALRELTTTTAQPTWFGLGHKDVVTAKTQGHKKPLSAYGGH